MKTSRRKRLAHASKHLEQSHTYLAAALIQMGKVCRSRKIETAAVQFDGKQIKLLFNPRFLDSITDCQLRAVLVHEALHFILKHPQRTALLQNPMDRFLYGLACDAVINDLIHHCCRDLDLPGQHVTGHSLIGTNACDKSAEEIFQLIRRRQKGKSRCWKRRLSQMKTLDDHDQWPLDCPTPDGMPAGGLSESAMADQFMREMVRAIRGYGLHGRGQRRRIPPSTPRFGKDLGAFLDNAIGRHFRCEANWAHPNRLFACLGAPGKLPTWEIHTNWNILVALDTSGSVPSSFLATAQHVARQPIPNAKVTLISFDTTSYEVPVGTAELKGGGGTRAQAVEEYIQDKMRIHPDFVFVFTDGKTEAPTPHCPDRWIWVLPTWGSARAVPAASRMEVLED